MLSTKSEKWNGKPRLAGVNARHPPSRNPVGILSWTFPESKGNDRADGLAGKATITGGLPLGSSEVLRSLRHYLRAQSKGHHTFDRLEERGVERGSAQ